MEKKPLEQLTMTLPPPAKLKQRGCMPTVELWADLMTPREAKRTQLTSIMPPPTIEFEARIIVYKTRGVPPFDGDPDTATDMCVRACVCLLSLSHAPFHSFPACA